MPVIPVSPLPGEIVVRPMRLTRPLPGLFDAPPLPVGTLVYARRSPNRASARSYWLEALDGTLLALLSEARFRRELEPAPVEPARRTHTTPRRSLPNAPGQG